MTNTQWPEVDGKNSSLKHVTRKEVYDLQQERAAYDEFYRKLAYVPDDFPEYKLQSKNVKKWALCPTSKSGYGKNSFNNCNNFIFKIKINHSEQILMIKFHI